MITSTICCYCIIIQVYHCKHTQNLISYRLVACEVSLKYHNSRKYIHPPHPGPSVRSHSSSLQWVYVWIFCYFLKSEELAGTINISRTIFCCAGYSGCPVFSNSSFNIISQACHLSVDQQQWCSNLYYHWQCRERLFSKNRCNVRLHTVNTYYYTGSNYCHRFHHFIQKADCEIHASCFKKTVCVGGG